MLHINRCQKTFLHLVTTCGDDDAAITAHPRIVEDIDEHASPFMIVTEQRVILKAVRKIKNKPESIIERSMC